MALTDDAHNLIRNHFRTKEKNLAIDATCGNGHDTQFLAEVGFKKIIGFDIQEVAIDATSKRVNDAGITGVELILAGHESMQQYIDVEVDCVMFNFGYLPNGDKNLTTRAENSVVGILAATRLVSDTGMISLICYPGHPTGAIEHQVTRQCFAGLHADWHIETHLAVSPKPTAPILYNLKRI